MKKNVGNYIFNSIIILMITIIITQLSHVERVPPTITILESIFNTIVVIILVILSLFLIYYFFIKVVLKLLFADDYMEKKKLIL